MFVDDYSFNLYNCVSGENDGDLFDTSNYNYEFESMRSLPSSDDEGGSIRKMVYPQFDTSSRFRHVQFELGMKFDNIALFKDAVKDYTINIGREVKWVKI